MPSNSGRQRQAAAREAAPPSLDRLREAADRLLDEALAFVPPAKVQHTAQAWLTEADLDAVLSGNPEKLANALVLAAELALFAPSASGQTAFDRLARQRPGLSGVDAAALASLRQAQLRLCRVTAAADVHGNTQLRDLANGEALVVAEDSLGPAHVGLALVGRLAPLADGRHLFIGSVTPLDEAALAVAAGFIKPGGRGLTNTPRCAEALFRHVVRHGTIEVPGLNAPAEGWEDDAPGELAELDMIALRWAAPGAVRDPADEQFVRDCSDLPGVLAALASAANTRLHGRHDLTRAYAAIADLQLDALRRRHAAGSGTIGLDAVAAAVEAGITAGELPPGTREAWQEAQRRLGMSAGTSPGASGRGDAELDRLIARIQALRAKTVDQGCTEAEALAAAEKVAELLDRYGLSLSELDLQRQTCEGAAVETGRKRAGPLDDCVPAVAAFFDCRVWGETGPGGTLRYVFFGLPADVAGARYLYDLVARAFETETALFRAGPTYASTPTGLRRTATNSFTIGLGRGITAKLGQLRAAREGALRGSAGRDLVVAKAGVVEAELAKLGLHFRARTRSAGRRVLRDVYEQGHAAGFGFDYTPGVADRR